MPIPASVKKSEVPPEEMNGKGIPLGGEEREHDADVEEGLKQDRGRKAESGEPREGVSGAEGRTKAAVAKDHEESKDQNGANETEFLSDIRKDEVRGGFRKIKEFLLTFHKPEPG